MIKIIYWGLAYYSLNIISGLLFGRYFNKFITKNIHNSTGKALYKVMLTLVKLEIRCECMKLESIQNVLFKINTKNIIKKPDF